MHMLASDRAGNHLHRTRLVVAPMTYLDPCHTAATRREECRMPALNAVLCEWLIKMPRGIQHDVNDPLDIPVGQDSPADVNPQTTRDGGLYLSSVQHLTLDLAGFHDILRQGLQSGFFWKVERVAPGWPVVEKCHD